MESRVEDAASLCENRLLGLLEAYERRRLVSRMHRVPLRVRDYVYGPGQPIEYVYFPIAGVISVVAEVNGAPGSMIEVATVGNEGMVGLPMFLGSKTTPGASFAQVEGHALRMGAKDFLEEADRAGPLTRVLHRYTQAVFVQVSQGTACNRVHNVQQRCARWILMTHDRVTSDEFLLTQEFLGQMLGEGRPAVNQVATRLQREGMIRYARGRLTVIDREGLESVSCECYRVVRDEYDRMFSGT